MIDSNIVILKLWGIYRTQSCDPPHGLEVIWGMSNTVISKLQDGWIILPLSFVHLENRICLSHSVQVAGVAWCAATRIMTGVGDLVQRTRDGRTCQILGVRAIERSGDSMCDLHRTYGDEERAFLGWASKPRSTVCHRFDLKTTGIVFFGLNSKPVATVSWLSLKIKVVEGFSILASKTATTVWWFVSQNHRDSFLVWVSKPSRLRFVACATKSMGGCDDMWHTSRSSGLLCVEANLARVL
jgi:hypothetical protein